MIDKELLDILACPDCKGDLKLEDNKLICQKCGEDFEIREGIPILLPKKEY